MITIGKAFVAASLIGMAATTAVCSSLPTNRRVATDDLTLTDTAPECQSWPYPEHCLIAGVRWHPNQQELRNMTGRTYQGMCWFHLDRASCAHIDKK